jgi:hypothetical protein
MYKRAVLAAKRNCDAPYQGIGGRLETLSR